MNNSLHKAISNYVSENYPHDVYVDGYIFMTDGLVRKLESFIDEITMAFIVPRDEAMKIVFTHLKDSPDKLVLLNQLLEDDEHLSHFTTDELTEIKTKIVVAKYAYAREQKYEHAARYRDVELTLNTVIMRKEANNA